MRFYEGTSVFQYSWNQVAQAIWKKYPNPESSHVLTEDTVSRKVVDNKLYTKRLLTKTNHLPKWGEKFVTNVMSVVEKVTYKPCPTNPEWTVAETKAWFESRIFGVSYAIQTFGLERYRMNVKKTHKGFVFVMKKLFPSPVEGRESDLGKKSEEHRLRLKDAARETAKRAKEIAQEKTRKSTIYAACES
ncbi:PRELI domain-containing protein 1, mitochondrial [Armadillidium vulgare]|nr:PRELI domain-containing protein 1, mitochondrial [Armadillidium vulgare]